MKTTNTGFEIKPEQRQSWQSIAMVWAGGMICVPCLMVGGVLSQGGLSIGQAAPFAQIQSKTLLSVLPLSAFS